ncbi:MAG: hypothetical protein ACTSW4_01840 [Candidatus Ranarchaeia archaeon]
MANAKAGDTVYLRGGIYKYIGPVAAPYHGVYEPRYSGTSEENRIIFKAYQDEQPTFSVTWSPESWTGWIFASGNHDYITFDGIKIQTTSSTQNAGFYLGSDDNTNHASHVKVTNCVIIGGSARIPFDDNADLNRMEDCDHCEFSYNKVGPFPGGNGGNDNYAGLKMYHDNNCLIKNNEFVDCYRGGVSIKGYTNDCEFSYNYFTGGEYGIRTCSYNDVATVRISIHDNVFANIAYNGFWLYAEGANSYGGSIFNNIFYNCGTGIQIGDNYDQNRGWKIYNNIIDTYPQIGPLIHTCYIAESDHNQFSNRNFSVAGYNSLQEWRNSKILVEDNSPGAGSLVSNPGFLNASGTMSQLDDFRLSSDSPCRGAGRNGVDMGANIDLVGIKSGTSSGGSPPPSPSNLRKLSQ